MKVSQLKNYVPTPDFRENILVPGATNNDIIKSIHSLAAPATADVAQLAKFFAADTRKKAAFKLWYFLRTRAKYVRDSNERQQIRLPRRFIYDTANKNNSGDCKSFSLFTIAMLRQLGLPAFLRYAGYTEGATKPSHVYAYTKDERGNEIIIDGCYPFFDKQKKPTFVKNYDMTVTSLSGVGSPAKDKARKFLQSLPEKERREVMRAFRRRCAARKRGKAGPVNDSFPILGAVIADESPITKKLSKTEKKARRKKRAAKAKKGLKKFGWGVAFVNLLPIRAAFQAIVAANFNALAHNLKTVYENRNGKTKAEWAKIEKIWYKLGGLKKALMKSIELGAKHKPLFLSKKAKDRFNKRTKGIKGISIDDVDYIGAAPVIAAALAAAAGVIAAIIPAIMSGLKKTGKNAEAQEVQAQGQEMVEDWKAKGSPAPAPFNQESGAPGAGGDGGEDEGEGEDIEGIHLSADGTQMLFDSLSKVATVGIQAAGAAVAKKAAKKPKLKKFLDTAGQGSEDLLVGTYLRKAGYTDAAKKIGKGLSTKNILLFGAAAVAALLGIYFVTKKSK